jgi:hypothetical protein
VGLLLVFALTLLSSRQDEALAMIHFPWQQLKYDIVFLGPRPGVRAMTMSRDRRIEIYVRPADDARKLAYDIAHELGHAVDFTQNTDEIRRKWMEARHINISTPWFGCNRCSDYNTPAGDFAETFAYILVGGQFSGKIAPAPTPEEMPALRTFFPQ